MFRVAIVLAAAVLVSCGHRTRVVEILVPGLVARREISLVSETVAYVRASTHPVNVLLRASFEARPSGRACSRFLCDWSLDQ